MTEDEIRILKARRPSWTTIPRIIQDITDKLNTTIDVKK